MVGVKEMNKEVACSQDYVIDRKKIEVLILIY